MVKEGINDAHMLELAANVIRALQTSKARLKDKEWSTEIKIVTCNECNGLIGILKTIQEESEVLNDGLSELINEVENYRNEFYVEGVKEFLLSKDCGLSIADLGCGDFYVGSRLISFSCHYFNLQIFKFLGTYPPFHSLVRSYSIRVTNFFVFLTVEAYRYNSALRAKHCRTHCSKE